jgi:hypothetical protein
MHRLTLAQYKEVLGHEYLLAIAIFRNSNVSGDTMYRCWFDLS